MYNSASMPGGLPSVGMEHLPAAFDFLLHVAPRPSDPVHDVPILPHVCNVQTEQLGNAKAGFEASQEESLIA